jgi:hypothetical protein
MLSKDTGDCLALAKYRNYDAVIQRLAERNLIGAPIVMLNDAVNDLETWPEQNSRVDDAVRLIRNELMPRLVQA